MNFLAHLYLSGPNEKVMIGNFMGDFVKGQAYTQYSPEIQQGILLHRAIDSFTDKHEIVLKTKERLRPKFHHYAPVIADVFYDHFLASRWNDYHPQPLEKFTAYFYRLSEKYHQVIPHSANRMLTYMKRDDWLYHYQFLTGIHQALSGMARRTPFDSNMEYATAELEKNYSHYLNDFQLFFPKLKEHADEFLMS